MASERMRAVSIKDGRGPAEALEVTDLSRPSPAAGEVLIRVRAAGVNRPDLLQREGRYPPPPGAPETLGLEVAGEIAQVGAGVSRWREGDGVTALLGGGGYAEYAVCDARHALPVPVNLTWEEAAALPETVFTVFANVFEGGRLQAGETLLLHGATSGIGVTAIQMAKAAGARVVAVSRGADKAAAAKRLDADVAIDATGEDFVAAAGGADVILDMVGAALFERNLECLNPGGRLVIIAVQGGAKAEIDLARLMLKRQTVTGSTLRSRPADEKARIASAVEQTVWPWIEEGRLRPVIDAVFPLEQAAEAHRRLEAGAHIGKVVLRV